MGWLYELVIHFHVLAQNGIEGSFFGVWLVFYYLGFFNFWKQRISKCYKRNIKEGKRVRKLEKGGNEDKGKIKKENEREDEKREKKGGGGRVRGVRYALVPSSVLEATGVGLRA